MSRKVAPRTLEEQNASSGPNWKIIGGIAGLGLLSLIGLLIVTVTSGGVAAPEPTPVLQDSVVAIAEYCDANPAHCIVVGSADAPVTLVEVSDYGCPHCANFNTESVPTLKEEYVDTGLVRWMILPYALSDQTHASASATMCAAEQGAELGLDFHEKLFGLQTAGGFNTTAGFVSVARLVGLDVPQFEQCLADQTYSDLVHLNRQAARQAQVNSTPTVFLNGRAISGNVGLELYRQRIEELLAGG
jgi:protein-disulfide isomerase